MDPQVYEDAMVFMEGDLPRERLLGHPDDYATLALLYYKRRKFVRALFWAIMASASSSFETAYGIAGMKGKTDA